MRKTPNIILNPLAIDLNGVNLATPPAGVARIGVARMAGRTLPRVFDSSGDASTMQPHVGRNNVAWLVPNAGLATETTMGFPTVSLVAGSSRQARAWASTNRLTRMRRIGYQTSTTVNALAGVWTSAPMCSPGGGGRGGFFFNIRFAIVDGAVLTAKKMFLGLANQVTTPTNVEVDTLSNHIGVGKMSSSNNLSIVGAGSLAQTPLDLGANFPAGSNTGDFYEFTMSSSPTAPTSDTEWQLTRYLDDGTSFTASGTITGNAAQRPTNITGLAPRWWTHTSLGGSTAGLDVMGVYLETDG